MKFLAFTGLALAFLMGTASAATTSTAESQFVSQTSATLLSLYPTAASATAHGYTKMTELGTDNTMIYTNFEYQNISLEHPNFLWYDRNGKLAGVDYEFPVSVWPQPPLAQYPVAKSKWVTIPEHVHFSYSLAGATVMHGARVRPNLKPGPITLAELQADNLVPAGATLLWATYHPTCWDLGFWVVPNPLGPFADKNPLVK